MTVSDIWKELDEIVDPEIPVLTILDMGVVRRLEIHTPDGEVVSTIEEKSPGSLALTPDATSLNVVITPTYTGCPAMNMIAAHIKMALTAQGFSRVEVKEVLSPAWTTDWMPDTAKEKLRAYGIAPPEAKDRAAKMLFSDHPVTCPHCQSTHTERISEFGSTACKSLHRCKDCLEPFDYFKCH